MRNFVGSDRNSADDIAERNLISGENRSSGDVYGGFGVLLFGGMGSVNDNQVNDNLIGTTVDANRSLPNNVGIGLINGATGNIVRNNVVSGNHIYGIWAEYAPQMIGSSNRLNEIQQNFVGLDPNLSRAVPNLYDGIHLGGGSEEFSVGMVGWTYANVVSGNGRHGVWLSGARGNESFGNIFMFNIVGLDTSGAFALPNGGDGFHLEDTSGGNTIGNNGFPNLISGNQGNGIALVSASNNLVRGNWIGRNLAGDSAQPNWQDGISLTCGTTPGSCSSRNLLIYNQVYTNLGNGMYLYGNLTSNQIAGGNLIEQNGGWGILSFLVDGTNTIETSTIQKNGAGGVGLVGSSTRVDSNTIVANGGWGVVVSPYYGSSSSPATAADDTVGTPLITLNDIDGNSGGGVLSLDTEPSNGATLHLDNAVGDNSGQPDVLLLWVGAVEILDTAYNPIIAGAYSVSVKNTWGGIQTGNIPNGGLWGPTGFDYNDVSTWFWMVGYYVDSAGIFYGGNPHTVTVVGPTRGTSSYTFDGVADDLSLGGQPAWISTGGLFRYQLAEVATNLDSDGDGVPDANDCAPSDPGYQGAAGVTCDADSDGFLDQVCGGTDCDDANAAVNPHAPELCEDGFDNDCDGLTDLDDEEDCARKASGCDCSTSGTTSPGLLLGLMALLAIRRRDW